MRPDKKGSEVRQERKAFRLLFKQFPLGFHPRLSANLSSGPFHLMYNAYVYTYVYVTCNIICVAWSMARKLIDGGRPFAFGKTDCCVFNRIMTCHSSVPRSKYTTRAGYRLAYTLYMHNIVNTYKLTPIVQRQRCVCFPYAYTVCVCV